MTWLWRYSRALRKRRKSHCGNLRLCYFKPYRRTKAAYISQLFVLLSVLIYVKPAVPAKIKNNTPMLSDRLITVAIHTYDRAHQLKTLLESEGIAVTLQNVNLTNPSVSAGIRVRIKECDLPQALRIIENIEILAPEAVRTLHDETHPSILVPVDFSDSSLKAALVAFRIAASLKVDIHLLHTYVDPAFSGRSVMQLSDSLTFDAPPVDTVDEVRLDRDLDKVAGEQMSEFEGKIRDKIRAGVIPGVRFTSEVTEGLPEETIYDYCTANKNPLTVMGTRGADSHSRQLVGSVAAEVLDSCRTVTLTVPESTPWAASGMPGAVVFFTTASQEDIIALDTLYRTFPDTPLCVTLVSVPPSRLSKAGPESLDKLLDYCRANYPAFTFKTSPLSFTNPVDDFDRITADHPADLIVVATRRKNIFSRLFNPSLAHRLLFRSDTPLMSIPVKG